MLMLTYLTNLVTHRLHGLVARSVCHCQYTYYVRFVTLMSILLISTANTAIHLAVWCSRDNNTQLHSACDISVGGDVAEVLRLVYVSGHQVNVQDNVGDTLLHKACECGYSDIVEILMLAGADETIINNRGGNSSPVSRKKGLIKLLTLLNRGQSVARDALARNQIEIISCCADDINFETNDAEV